MSFIIVAAIYLGSAFILPFPNWVSFQITLNAVITAPNVPLRQRLGMIVFLAREVAVLPLFAFFWLIDEVFFATYHNEEIRDPIFIVSQPRSGTTFLLRTLSEDQQTFLSVKHLEWRYPYISFWKLIDALQLRQWLENKSYWPNTELGRQCNKIHNHVLGNFEEFGIFLEERFFQHYFVFRRFPFPDVLRRVGRFDQLPQATQLAIISTFLRVVRKVYYYRGQGEIFLAKENENVEFCRALIDLLPDARLLFIVREPRAVLKSYRTMSVTCTEVKHGLDPESLPGWHDVNIDFRRDECRKFVAYFHDIRARRTTVLISFQDFTTEVLRTTLEIYRQLELPLTPKFQGRLQDLQQEQRSRSPGYVNLPCDEPGFDFYADFVRMADERPPTEKDAVS